MSATIDKIKIEDSISLDFERQEAQLPGDPAIRDIRRKAMRAFLRQGIPGRKNEEYKYSNPDKLLKAEYSVAAAVPQGIISKGVLKQFEIEELGNNRVVLLNGVYQEKLSVLSDIPVAVVVCSLSEAFNKYKEIVEKHFSQYADAETDPFIALNTAFAGNGLFIYVPDKMIFQQPLHIINIITMNEPALIQTRNLFVVGAHAELNLVESSDAHDLNDKITVNALTELVVSDYAKVQFYRLQNDCEKLNLITTTQVVQKTGSHFDTNTVTLNGDWVRNNLNIVVAASECITHLNGLFIAKGTQYIDNHTLVDHRKPTCESNQLYKGILDERATGVFNGKIYVRRDAQKINAYQSSRNILLSDDATVNTKPQLEIFANDVKCSHGSSTGHLNEEALFYLRSRGISTDGARRLLLHAFAMDVVNTIAMKALRLYVEELVSKRLRQ